MPTDREQQPTETLAVIPFKRLVNFGDACGCLLHERATQLSRGQPSNKATKLSTFLKQQEDDHSRSYQGAAEKHGHPKAGGQFHTRENENRTKHYKQKMGESEAELSNQHARNSAGSFVRGCQQGCLRDFAAQSRCWRKIVNCVASHADSKIGRAHV